MESWEEFLNGATVVDLKCVLRKLESPTAGNKSALKIRIQDAIKEFSQEQILALIPNETHADNDDGDDDDKSERNDDNSSDNNDENESLDNEVNRLRNLLQKKREIMKLKKELMQLEMEDDQSTKSASYNFKDMEDSIPSFSGDDYLSIDRWIEMFEESAEVMKLDGRTKFIFGKRLLTGTARLFIRTTHAIKSWGDLKRSLRNEFRKHVTKADVHDELRGRRKRRDESIQQYVLSMQEIASAGSIEEEDLIQYVIKGIPDSDINKIILYNANNMHELKIALRKYEKIKNNNHQGQINKKVDSEHKHMQQSVKEVKCYNCNQKGHISKNCKNQKQITCFKCGSVGHKAMVCKAKATSSQPTYNQAKPAYDRNHQNESAEGGQCHVLTTPLHNFERNVEYTFYKGNYKCNYNLFSLIDSGSSISLVQEQFVPPHMITAVDPAQHKYTGINNSPLTVLGTVDSQVNYDKSILNLKLMVVRKNTMMHPIILGRDFILRSNLVLEKKENIETNATTEAASYTDDKDDDFTAQILNIDVSNDVSEVSLNINKNLAYPIQKKIRNIFEPVWGTNNYESKKLNDDFEMSIEITKEEPFYCVARRLPYAHKIELRKILDNLLSKGIIRESNSPFASPIVLVRKKTGELRLCVDYRQLNKVTVRDNYPLPLIEDHLDRLKDKRYFTTLDLKNAFHQVKMASDSIKYTSFITPLGQYEYTRMPFGLKNAPSVFERYMKHIFQDLVVSDKILTFIDDILIATETTDEHLEIMKEVVKVIEKNSLQLRFDKCSFLMEEIVYLGYMINIDGVRPNDNQLEGVKNFPIPTCTKDIHSFLGLCSYFRKFIKNFSTIAKPLYDLLKKNTPFIFGPREYEVFETLKQKLLESPVLSIYNPSADTELHCDASAIGYGAVLVQKQNDKKYHPVFYFSKRVTETESRYHSFELETLAIVYALRRFRIYLLGIKFKIVTDCQALSQTLNKKMLNPRISRWALELQSYDFILEHRKGERMLHADALSRSANVLNIHDASFEYVLAAAQRQDPKIVKVASELEKAESSKYEMIDGLVYRKVNGNILFYVPEHMEIQVIRTHHEAMCHLGVDKCFKYLSRSYWFEKMKEKIRNYIKTCLKCIYFSPDSGKVEGSLHNIPKGTAPFNTLHVDHYGPLSKSHSNKKHIFVVVDAFTKYVKLYAARSTQSKEAMACLKSYFEYYSRPRRIISDRGTCFTSKEFSDFLELNGVQHIKIASHCPQSNGQVERVNRMLTPMLAKECDTESTADWDKHLVKVEFAINNTINRSTGFSPAMLLFGTNQNGELCDKVMSYLEQNNVIDREDLEVVRNQAGSNMERVQSYNKVQYDKNHKPPKKYKKGDYVMIKNVTSLPGINKKLFAKYRGPYEVEKEISGNRYLIKDIDGMQLTRIPYKGVCAPCNMRPFVSEMHM